MPRPGRWRRPGCRGCCRGGRGRAAPCGEDLAGRYEALRSVALAEGAGPAGLSAGLLMAQGVAAWMRGWRACVPPAPGAPAPAGGGAGPAAEVVGVLAAMALACAGGE